MAAEPEHIEVETTVQPVEIAIYPIDGGYFLAAGVTCFILAAIGVALLVWILRGKRRP